MKELLFNVIGHPGAGKTEACKRLAHQWGFEVFSPSALIRDFANARGMAPKGRREFSQCHELMIAEDPLALVRPILGSEALRLCADGLRSLADARRVQTYGGHVVALVASQEARYNRIIQDGDRSGARLPPSLDDFRKSEMADAHADPRLTNTQAVINMADFTIDTESLSIKEATHALDTIVAELLNVPINRIAHASD